MIDEVRVQTIDVQSRICSPVDSNRTSVLAIQFSVAPKRERWPYPELVDGCVAKVIVEVGWRNGLAQRWKVLPKVREIGCLSPAGQTGRKAVDESGDQIEKREPKIACAMNNLDGL